MSEREVFIVNKLDILSAVNSANISNPSTKEPNVALLNNTWKKALQMEQSSNTYLHCISLNQDDFRILERYGVSGVKENVVSHSQNNKKKKRNFRSFFLNLFCF